MGRKPSIETLLSMDASELAKRAVKSVDNAVGAKLEELNRQKKALFKGLQEIKDKLSSAAALVGDNRKISKDPVKFLESLGNNEQTEELITEEVRILIDEYKKRIKVLMSWGDSKERRKREKGEKIEKTAERKKRKEIPEDEPDEIDKIIMDFAREHEKIRGAMPELQKAAGLSLHGTKVRVKKLVEKGLLEKRGERAGAWFYPAT